QRKPEAPEQLVACVTCKTRIEPRARRIDEIRDELAGLVVAMDGELHVVDAVLRAVPRQPFVLATDEPGLQALIEPGSDARIRSNLVERAFDGGVQTDGCVRIAARETCTDVLHGAPFGGHRRTVLRTI